MATSLNYIGSSGFGVDASGRYGRLTSAPRRAATPTPSYAVFDISSGKVVDSRTGEIYSGKDPMSGKTFQAGVEVPIAKTGVDVASRYQPVEVIRSPATASAQEDLMATFKKNAARQLEDFGSSLNAFKTDLNAARTLNKEATNIQPTVDALSSAQRDYSGSMDEATAAYQRALADSAAAQRGIVTQANDTLGDYDTALNNILANQLGLVSRNVNKYKMGTSTPRSLGSAETSMLARGALEASLPIAQAKIQRRYDILGSLAMPTESAIAGRNIDYAGRYLPSAAGSELSSQQSTATTIQALRDRAASAGLSNAVAYLQAYGLPAQLQQQLFSGQISELEALRQIEEASRYRGLMDTEGVQVSQPIAYNMALPGYPQFPTTGGTGTSRYGSLTGTPTQTYNSASVGGVPYRPIAGAPGGSAFDWNGYWASRSGGGAVAPEGTRYGRNSAGQVVALAPGAFGEGYSAPAMNPNIGGDTGLTWQEAMIRNYGQS